MQKLFFIVFLAALTNIAVAQNTGEKETKEIHFQVTTVFKRGDSLLAYLNVGKRQGIEKNLFGKCINLYRNGVSPNYKEIGTCKILIATDTTSFAYIQLYKKKLFKGFCSEGRFYFIKCFGW